jgi:FHS family L-fucose permease-like MFS transporter
MTRIFTLKNGRNVFITFVLVTSLFLLWGFCNGLIDVLNKHFQSSLQISKAESGLVQFANYIAYFLMAVPAGLLARRFGYKGGILIGLVLIALGAFWFIPAISIGAYWAFLLGLFVLAAGLATLETIANPYATVLGPPESGALRINIAQSCNGIGWMLGPIIGGNLIFGGGGEGAASSNAGLAIPYMGIGIIVAVLTIVFALAYVPDIHAEDEVKAESEGKGTKPLVARKHFLFGVVAQFCYVAAQSGIFGFFINYVVENAHVADKTASNWLGLYGFGLFLAGRLCGSAILGVAKPQAVLAAYAVINIVFTALAIVGHGTLGLVGLFGTFFFMSIMFPTIFALGIHGLGEHTKLGASVIVMAIVGGAIVPPIMGLIADHANMRYGFIIPLVCFAIVALYGLFWKKLEAGDADSSVSVRPVH